MPDIKHTFSAGKMNKDLDERLVPNGEYRDAMNIQVSTSEGSDVGAVQNVLGNRLVSAESTLYENLSAQQGFSTGRCIGSISNGQNEKLYWFIKDREISSGQSYADATVEFGAYMPKKDMIVEADASSSPTNPVVNPVLVDIFETKFILNPSPGIQADSNYPAGQNIYFLVDGAADSDYMPKAGDAFSIYNYDNLFNYTATTRPWKVLAVINDTTPNLTRIYTNLNPAPGGNIAALDFAQIQADSNSQENLIITFTSEKVLNFNTDPNKIITGINIIDNLLFWTDDYSEPKKINIDRCKEHTDSFHQSTKLPSGEFLQEKHITVIKPAPKTAPVLQLIPTENFNQPGIIANFKFQDQFGSDLSPGFHGLNPDGSPRDYLNFVILNTSSTTPFDLVANQTVIHLKSAETNSIIYDTDSDGTYDSLNQNFNQEYQESNDWDIRMMIVGGDAFLTNPLQSVLTPTGAPLTGYVDLHAVIIGMAPNITRANSSWVVNFEQAKDTLFEQKFPRFSYRYIYADGEYSPFGPFSEVAFLPGSYSMSNEQGYNTAMSNNLSKVIVEQFVTADTPEDVEKIEILYKESNSPNVYIVDSISKNDSLGRYYSATSNPPNLGAYEITSDTIFKTVASNQLLRPYDNVPTQALAQEIVGNRIVYANYLQNLNISDLVDNKVLTSVSYSSRNLIDEFGSKSLKTLREYQLGVVYTDDYGRETPVLTDESSSVVIPITESTNSNYLSAQITTPAPLEAKNFKFYVKESSNEYYNLAMDRWYDSSGGNIWISFNSSDRNKIDEETFLYLKKAHGADLAVQVPSKYKVLAIANEAPKSIKLNRKRVRKRSNMSSGSLNTLFPDSNNFPLNKLSSFICELSSVDANQDLASESNLSVRFFNLLDDNVSELYEISGLEYDVGSNELIVSIDESFGFDMSFFEDSTSTAQAPVQAENISMEIYKGTVEDSPEYEGKFFVKIFKDFNITQFVTPLINNAAGFRVVHQLPVYYYDQDSVTTTNGVMPSKPGGNDFGWSKLDPNSPDYDPLFTAQDLLDNVQDVTDSARELFGDGTVINSTTGDPNAPRWFIDKLSMEGVAITHTALGIPGYTTEIFTGHTGYSTDFYDQAYNPYINPVTNQTHFRRTMNGVNLSQIDISISGLPHYNFSNYGSGNNNFNNSHIFFPYPDTNEYDDHNKLVEGQFFRFANDVNKVVYKIINVEIFNIFNYSGSNIQNGGHQSTLADSSTLGVQIPLANNLHNSYNHRRTYRLTLDKPIGDLGGYNPTQDATQTNQVNIDFLAPPTRLSVKDSASTANPAVFETKPKEDLDLDLYYQISDTYAIEDHGTQIDLLSYFNCYSFGNGVESNRIRDDFNAPTIDKGVRVSTVLESEYKEEKRKSGLIYSGIYNSTSGINRTNQFIQAEKITKDLNPEYGSIQKLHTRNSDLVALCEDKVVRIYANKDALFNADGNVNLTATDKVLGTAQPFAGEYGISKNPESFVTESYRNYFTDKQRGVVLRLSMDGLTPISDYGMSDYFSDNLKTSTMLIGSYDVKKSDYNLSLIKANPTLSETVSFDEDVNGWSSFKSFIPETGVSLSNEYYTFQSGLLYKHHDDKNGYNNFYGVQVPSSINVLLNDISGSVKSFKNLSYEGSQSQVLKNVDARDNNYYNLNDKLGWYVENITTDIEDGYINEFIEKENKWFNYIKGNQTMDTGNFTLQGIGLAQSFTAPPVTYNLTIQDIADED